MELQERRAKASLGLSLEPIGRRYDETGALVVTGNVARLSFALQISNGGRKSAGRTAVTVWVPRGKPISWAADGAGNALSGAPAFARSPLVLVGEEGVECEAVELPRSLDAVPLIGERLFLKIEAQLPYNGRRSFPLRVLVRAEGAKRDVQADFPIRLVHRPAYE